MTKVLLRLEMIKDKRTNNKETCDLKHGTRNPQPATRNPQPATP